MPVCRKIGSFKKRKNACDFGYLLPWKWKFRRWFLTAFILRIRKL
jgi:hypothetical protein